MWLGFRGGQTCSRQPFAGHSAQIDGGPIRLAMSVTDTGMLRAATVDEIVAVTISFDPDAAAKLFTDPDGLFAAARLSGSANFAETLAFVFRNLKWEAVADLAAVIGDIPAHRLVKIGQSLADSLQDAARNTAENIREYAVEESAMLVAPSDILAFGEAVNRLRDDVARLEKRLIGSTLIKTYRAYWK